MPDLPD